MNVILHLTCSPRGAAAHSTRFSRHIVDRLRARHPQARVTHRDFAAAPLPHVDAGYAQSLGGGLVQADGASPSLELSDRLIAELQGADCVVIGTPMHNYGVPSVLKAWIDHVVRIHRTFAPTPQGKQGLLQDRPVYIAVAAGGGYADDPARQPDFVTPYLRAALGTIGLRDLRFFPLQRLVLGDTAIEQAWQSAEALLESDSMTPL
ncbi:MAG TPA: NAD(P)H-dependent oxidoreductase, partial [Burkholderiaceae bacterium]